MIVASLRLAPFAGLADSVLSFEPGLNVVLGPNEAGKSTVLRALASVLFVRTDLTPKRGRTFVQPLLPVAGGDTVRVELGFSHEGGDYSLVRQWGPSSWAEMRLPDGGVLTGEDAIEARLDEALGVKQGTFESVFLARQSALATTLDELRDAPAAVRDLDDILSAAIRETDGVSVDALKERLEQERSRYFSQWDVERGMPRGNRGVGNPWKKSVGAVLSAYYDRERARQEHAEALGVEARLDELNAAIAQTASRCDALRAHVERHEASVEGARSRRTLELRLAGARDELESLKRANVEWPTREADFEKLAGEIRSLERRGEELAQERAEVDAAEARKALRETLEKARAKAAAVERARAARDALPAITLDEVEAIVEAEERGRKLEIELAAGRLRAALASRIGSLAVTVTAGVDEPRAAAVGPGETLELQADGTLRVEHADWVLTVASGAQDFASLAEELKRARGALEELLARKDAKDAADARKRLEAGREAGRDVAEAEKALAEVLGDRSLEQLEAEAGEPGERAPSRPATELYEELGRTESELERAVERREALADRLAALAEAHGSHDELLDALLDARRRAVEIEQELAGLAPLPEGVADAEAFLSEFDRTKKELEAEKEARSDLMLQRAGLRLPERSAEELLTERADRERDFERALRKGRTILRILGAVEELEAEDEGLDPGAALRSEVGELLSRMSGARYQDVRMSETLPAGLVTPAGVLPVALLSTGTRAVLGLAVRLAMVGYFLGDAAGFMAMDDPLVDLDPDRQKLAAATLARFAERGDRQLVVFTCHPTHARLLGGALQKLTGP